MAKGMDTGTIALLAGGGYLAYAAYSGSWPFSPAVPVAITPTIPTIPNYVPAKTPVTKPAAAPTTTPATPPTGPAAGTTAIVNGATYQWNGSAWTLIQAAPIAQECPTGYHRANNYDPNAACMPPLSTPTATFCDTGTPGWSIQDGVCKQTPAPDTSTISQKMVAAAGMSDGLSTDEWCYYFTQVTGSDCPIDPGGIDPSVYSANGLDDRTSPMAIGTWLSIMQGQAPQLGLSGLGDDSTPGWGLLVAAGLALFLMGGR